MADENTKGRKSNAAQPLGERRGTASQSATKATGKAERASAGPDGPKAEAVSRTFKR
jgi:hypothetical protein